MREVQVSHKPLLLRKIMVCDKEFRTDRIFKGNSDVAVPNGKLFNREQRSEMKRMMVLVMMKFIMLLQNYYKLIKENL